MQLPFSVQVVEALQELSDDDGDVFFAEYARLHLRERVPVSNGKAGEATGE